MKLDLLIRCSRRHFSDSSIHRGCDFADRVESTERYLSLLPDARADCWFLVMLGR